MLISIGGNEILKRPLIDLTKNEYLNVDTTSFPKYHGLMPSFWVLNFSFSIITGINIILEINYYNEQ